MSPSRPYSRRRCPRRLLPLLTLPLLAFAGLAPAPSSARGLAVTGSVVDERDRPVAGADVTLHAVPSGPERGLLLLAGDAHPAPVVRGRTDAHGSFRLEAPDSGFWTVVVRHRGRMAAEHQLLPLLGAVELPPAALLPAEPLGVRVVTEAGEPAVGVPILFQGRGGSRSSRHWRPWGWQPPAHRVARTGPEGRAALRRFPGEAGTLQAVASGRVVAVELAGGEAGAVVRLPTPPASRVVRAVGRDGAPVPGVVVSPEGSSPVGVTGEDGTVRVAVGERERTTLRLVAADGRAATEVLEAPADGEPAPVQVTLTPPVEVVGRVVAERGGKGISGAWAWAVTEPGAAVRSGRDGGFRLPLGSDRSAVVLAAAAPGFLPESTPPFEASGPAQERAVLRLRPEVRLEGRVVDGEGAPLPEAAVRVFPATGQPYLIRPGEEPRTARSGEDGRFRIGGLQGAGALSVRVTLPGYAPWEERVALETAIAGEEAAGAAAFPEIEVVLGRGVRLRGRVVEESGAPVSGAEVVLVPQDVVKEPWSMEPAGTARAESGPDGGFEIADLPPGRVDLGVTADGHPPLVLPGVEVPGTAGSLDLGELVLESEAVLEGAVEDPRGSSVAGARVEVQVLAPHRVKHPLAWNDDRDPLTTGVDGRFRVGGLRAGDLVAVRVWKEGFTAGVAEGVRVPPEEEVRILLEPAAYVSGRVVDEAGNPVAHSHVYPSGPSEGMAGLTAPVEMEEDGTFVAQVPPGEVHLRAVAPGHEQAAPVRLELAAGERREGVELVLRANAFVRGRVFSPDGEPVPGAQVAVTVFHGSGSSSSGRVSGAGGEFEVEARPGPVLVEASKEGWATASAELDLPPEGADVDLHLGRGARVAGRVVGAGGEPAAGHWVRLQSRGAALRLPPGQVTAADGTFVFEGIPDGTYLVGVAVDLNRGRFGRPDHVHPEELVVAGGLPVSGLTVRLPRRTVLRGRVLGVTAPEIPSLRVRALLEGEGYRQGREGRGLVGGSYEVTDLEPGLWQVSASVSGSGKTGHGTVEVLPGQEEVRLDLELRQGLTITGIVSWNGEPAPGVQVGGSGVAEGAGVGTVSGPGGRFELAGLAPGRQELRLIFPRLGISTSRTVEISEGDPVALDVETARVRGTVLSALGMAPVPEASVALHAPETGYRYGFQAVRTAGDGVFLLAAVEAGTYELRIEKPGYGAVAVPVTVGRGEVTLAPVVLEPE